MLAGDDDVYVMAAAKTVIHHVEESSWRPAEDKTRTISAFLLKRRSMNPGSWCVKPLWSCRQTWLESR